MRKAFKKILAMASAALMTLSMTTGVFAAPDTVSIAINTEEESTFTAYEVMKAEETDPIVLPNGTTIGQYAYTPVDPFDKFFAKSEEDAKANDKSYYIFGGKIYKYNANKQAGEKDIEVATDKYETQKAENDGDKQKEDGTTIYNLKNTNETEAAILANALRLYASEKNVAGKTMTKTETSPVKATDLEKGFYLIAETATPQGKAEEDGQAAVKTTYVASKPILVVVTENVRITPKSDSVNLTKKILEKVNGVDRELDANNANINDPISYKVTTNIPTYEANVNKGKLKFTLTDTFSNGLSFKETTLQVKVGDNVLVKEGEQQPNQKADYELKTTLNPEHKKNEKETFEVNLTPDAILKYQGQSITLTYEAILNPLAVVNSSVGNPNKIELSYTNNPGADQSVGYLDDEVKTFTYGFKIKKIDKDGIYDDMSGAEFRVYKKLDNDTEIEIGKFSYDQDGQIVSSGKVTTTKDGYASVQGMDEGTYYIEETKAPTGFVKIETPVEVYIKDQGVENDKANNVPVPVPNGVAEISIKAHTDAVVGKSNDATVDTTENVENNIVQSVTSDGNGKLDIQVQVANYHGIILPETGAKTAMYTLIGGGLLLLVGGIFFVLTKKFAK